ncbi:1503_t:CDS:2 [Ambispora gerdemannii]|uniref:1503_t:CDS:1 n=1 Tax=Ambispora gerdemannii TaxID=144530 RepID=A0A9N8YJ72_9GLOM|nr:1503_t:CDS:2 [Ambispora gerdemannii]
MVVCKIFVEGSGLDPQSLLQVHEVDSCFTVFFWWLCDSDKIRLIHMLIHMLLQPQLQYSPCVFQDHLFRMPQGLSSCKPCMPRTEILFPMQASHAEQRTSKQEHDSHCLVAEQRMQNSTFPPWIRGLMVSSA